MITLLIVVTLFVSGLFSLILGKQAKLIKTITLIGLLLSLCMLGLMFFYQEVYYLEWQTTWIEYLNVDFALRMSGLAWTLSCLTLLMGVIAWCVSSPTHNHNIYFACFNWTLMATLGIFVASDLFLFFVFWELALIPVYILIGFYPLDNSNINNNQALFRYILFTQASGLILLLSIVGLVIAHFSEFGILTFDYQELRDSMLPLETQAFLALGFMLAFVIKLPIVPFHRWLNPLFMSAPAPVLLIGVMIKTALFGILQFSWPLFPKVCADGALYIMIIAVITIIYGSILAFAEKEPILILAYGNLSHAGFMLMGAFSTEPAAYVGVIILMLSQAFSTGGLIILLNSMGHQKNAVSTDTLGSLWQEAPKFSVFILMFVLASLGAPLFGNFMGEWLVLWGVWTQAPIVAMCAALSILLSAAYLLRLFQNLCLDKPKTVVDNVKGSSLVLGAMILVLLVIGLYPKTIIFCLDAFKNSEPESSSLSKSSSFLLGNFKR